MPLYYIGFHFFPFLSAGSCSPAVVVVLYILIDKYIFLFLPFFLDFFLLFSNLLLIVNELFCIPFVSFLFLLYCFCLLHLFFLFLSSCILPCITLLLCFVLHLFSSLSYITSSAVNFFCFFPLRSVAACISFCWSPCTMVPSFPLSFAILSSMILSCFVFAI